MISNEDKKEIAGMIAYALQDFKSKNLSFRARKLVDTPTDVNQPSSQDSTTTYVVTYVAGQLAAYFPLSGAGLNDGANIGLGTGTGTKIGTTNLQKLGFWNAAPIIQPTVTGSRGGNAALTSLLSKLALEGLIVDSTT